MTLQALRYHYERVTEYMVDPPSFAQWLEQWRSGR